MDAQPTIHPTAVVDPTAILANDCRVEALAYIGPGCTIDAGVTVGVRASVISAAGSASPRATVVRAGVRIEPGAVVNGPLTVGRHAIVRAGAVVTEDVPPRAVVGGNPAEVVGYTHEEATTPVTLLAPPIGEFESIEVAGATLYRLRRTQDLRGSLAVAELGAGLPFLARRVFMVFDVANQKIRGSHAHRALHEYLIALGGSVTVVVDNGRTSAQVVLDAPDLGLHIPPGLWSTQYEYSSRASLVVLASHEYDEADYIRDYDDYLVFLER